MTQEQIIKAVAEYIANNAQEESRLLYGQHAAWTISPFGILDMLSELTGIPKDTISDWVDNAPKNSDRAGT